MPFARVTLINNSNHLVIATLQLLPGPVLLEVAANAHSTEVVQPQQAPVNAIDHGASLVKVYGMPGANLVFAANFGGGAGDDIQEAFVCVGLDLLPSEHIGAWILDSNGALSWVEQPLR